MRPLALRFGGRATIAAALICSGSVHSATRAAAPPEPQVDWTVRPHDTLIGLSRSTFTGPAAWREIARLNRLPDPNRIHPGQVLRVPVRLLRTTALPARVTSTIGDVRVGGGAVQAGATIEEGQQLQTAPNASAVVELADGSRVRVPPSSVAELLAHRVHGDQADAALAVTNGRFSGALRMVRGSVEVFAAKLRRATPLEVRTPTAVVGVRGTQYRVGFDADQRITRAEVLDGEVRVEPADRSAAAALREGFGAALGADARLPPVRPLPAAPDLAAMPALFERPLVRFALPAERETVRVQVAADEAFDRIVDDQEVPAGTDVRIANLADARWHLRARRLDAQGIGGYDAVRPFVLKARPEPPATNTPRPGAKLPVGAVEFAWSPNLEAASVRLQVARDAAFADLVAQQEGLAGANGRATLDAPGSYFWRLASTRADGDRGPFGDPQRFELRPNPEPPTGGVAPDGRSLALAWSGRAEDTQHVELARDPQFRDIVAQADLDTPEWTLPRPPRGGTYYFRYRSVEPDGYVGPYSATLVIEVPHDWRWLLLLVPLLAL